MIRCPFSFIRPAASNLVRAPLLSSLLEINATAPTLLLAVFSPDVPSCGIYGVAAVSPDAVCRHTRGRRLRIPGVLKIEELLVFHLFGRYRYYAYICFEIIEGITQLWFYIRAIACYMTPLDDLHGMF